MYVVYLLYVELGGRVTRYVGSGEWPQRLRSHARGYSSLAARGGRPRLAVVLAVTEDRETARRLEAYFQRLLRHEAGRFVRAQPLKARLPGRFKPVKIDGLTVYIPDPEGVEAQHTAGEERPGVEPRLWTPQPRGPPAGFNNLEKSEEL